MAAKKKRGRIRHTTCRVGFEDYSGHLHRTTVRIPRGKGSETTGTLSKLVQGKTGIRPRFINDVTCADAGRATLPTKGRLSGLRRKKRRK